jgi:excisionase family DNA binding protein
MLRSIRPGSGSHELVSGRQEAGFCAAKDSAGRCNTGMIDPQTLAIQPNVYYTVEETAQLLRVSRHAVVELLRSGRAQGVRIGRQWRILGAALLDMSAREIETEETLVSDWLAASSASLAEVWDNEADAVYDKL